MSWKFACEEAALAENELRECDVEGTTVLLLRAAGGECFAYPPLCPHQEEPLRKGACDEGVITCFRHLWQWDARTGACVGTEARIPLKLYEVRRVNGRVEVKLDHVLGYDYDDA
jgi:toluene monooxygenase system ferredoxin subunit